jgi:DNA-directed RNA polymerase specialized sigma24 family protein
MDGIDLELCDSLARRGAKGDARATEELIVHLRGPWVRTIENAWREMKASMPQDFVARLTERLALEIRQPCTLSHYVAWSARTRRVRRTLADWMDQVVANAIGDDLARRGATDDRGAIKNLVARLHSEWVDAIRTSWRLRYSTDQEDIARDIALNLLRKFEQTDALKSYVPWLERHPGKAFSDWINIVVVNATRSYLKPSRNSIRNLVQMHATLDSASVRPPYTDGYCAAQLREVAGEVLTEPQIAALNLWLEGASFDEIAADSGLCRTEAQGHLRAAIARLRRRFVAGAAT